MTTEYHGNGQRENENAVDIVIEGSTQLTVGLLSGSPDHVHYGIVDSTEKIIIPIKYDFDSKMMFPIIL